jgi:hypothetical protein
MEPVPNPTKSALIIGWICVFVGMLSPIFFLVTAPQTMIFTFPIASAILVLGLFMVAGRFPPRRDSGETLDRQDARSAGDTKNGTT